jgi:hypothetical protein
MAGRGIPEPDRPVLARGSDELAAGREGHFADRRLMAGEAAKLPAAPRVPEADHRGIARDQRPAVGRECDRLEATAVRVGLDLAAALNVPEPEVRAARRQNLAIWREREPALECRAGETAEDVTRFQVPDAEVLMSSPAARSLPSEEKATWSTRSSMINPSGSL